MSTLVIFPNSMPSRILLSTDAQVSESLPQSTKRRRAFSSKAAAISHEIPSPLEAVPPQNEPVIPTQEEFEPPTKKRKVNRLTNYPCTHPGCTKTFTRPCNLEAHIRSHTGERPFMCTYPDCGRAFFKKTHLTQHIKGVHDKEKKYRCTELIYPEDKTAEEGEECGACFTTNQHLKRHMESHEKKLPHTCSAYPPCTAGFRKRTQLERHLRTEHLGLKAHQCKEMILDMDGSTPIQCPEAFDTKGKLVGHVQRDHIGGGGYKYFCEECTANDEEDGCSQDLHSGSLVYWPDVDSELDEEEEEEEEEQTLNLEPEPPLAISSANNKAMPPPTLPSTPRWEFNYPDLNSHPTPPSTTSSSVTTSSLRFKTYSDFKHHLKTHHPPICKFCSKHCQTHRDLRNHIYENHTFPVSIRRTFSCTHTNTCTSSFTRKSALKIHIETVHEGKKEFKCLWENCSMAFGHKSSMQKHYDRHINPRPRRKSKEVRNPGEGEGGGGGRNEKVGLLIKLTGHGYEKLPNRVIPCVIDGCDRRFGRWTDLQRHLAAKENGHGFSGEKVLEVMEVHGVVRTAFSEGEYDEDDDDEDEDEDEDDHNDDNGEIRMTQRQCEVLVDVPIDPAILAL